MTTYVSLSNLTTSVSNWRSWGSEEGHAKPPAARPADRAPDSPDAAISRQRMQRLADELAAE
jgi:hypothetical protein